MARLALSRAAALVASLLLAITPTVNSATHPFQIDLLLPLNTTYLPTDTFPLALALHNVTAALATAQPQANWTVGWHLTRAREGRIPMTNEGVSDTFTPFLTDQLTNLSDSQESVLFNPNSRSSIFISSTNATSWIQSKQRGDTFSLQWWVQWGDKLSPSFPAAGCTLEGTQIAGSVMFSVEAPWEAREAEGDARRGRESGWVDVGKGVSAVDVGTWPACPAVVGSERILETVEGEGKCPVVMGQAAEGKVECGILMTDQKKKELLSAVQSLATSSQQATATTAVTSPTSRPTGGVGRWEASGTMAVGLAVVGGLALAA